VRGAIGAHVRGNFVAYLALFFALIGSAYAADLVGPRDIAKNAVRAKQVKDGSLGAGELKPGVLDAVGGDSPALAGVPSGAVTFFERATCPDGWSELTAARGRYLVGLPGGGTLGATVGTQLTDLENRAVGQHDHAFTPTPHSHTISIPVSGGPVGVSAALSGQPPSGSTTIATSSVEAGGTISGAGAVAGTNAPYMQLLVCVKS
jgi:hypothetical protein